MIVSGRMERFPVNSKKNSKGSPSARAAGDAVSRRLRDYYDSVREEAIPDRFLDLLERLDAVDRQDETRRETSAENARD
ncbi:NepR family anti-sigma factor [Zhengella sp. ZM62]|uniref:NepR family anti-sigma factor n=1 Tax=Zhengella sedimenti TaxID=3390035 RepID=UPI0039755500